MKKTELVLVPGPGMGHLPSFGKLAKLIAQLQPSFSVVVFIISDPADSSLINAYVESQSQSLDADSERLSFVVLPAPPHSPEPTSFVSVVELNKPLVKQAVLDRVKSRSSELAGFILDMFCTSMIDVANELHVPSFVFFTSGAYGLSLLLHLQSLADDDEFSDPDKEFDVPGFRNRVPRKVLPGPLFDDGGLQMMISLARRFRECKGILVNTYMELEPYSMKALLDQANDDNKIPTVYPVGPILELDNKSRGGSHKEERDSIMEWLDQQPSASVVFLCFGSLGYFDEDQVKEIAKGLDRAGHRFLWSLRKPPPEGKSDMPSQHETYVDVLPEGFLEKTADRGKIIGWAPQVDILAHQALGGFVSHCGWNSILESLWFGHPIATWPIHAEQQLNAFVLVKELGVAVEIRMDYRRDWRARRRGNVLVMAEEIEAGLQRLMSMDEGMRKKVRELSDKGRKALQDGGSSYYWLCRFLAYV